MGTRDQGKKEIKMKVKKLIVGVEEGIKEGQE